MAYQAMPAALKDTRALDRPWKEQGQADSTLPMGREGPISQTASAARPPPTTTLVPRTALT